MKKVFMSIIKWKESVIVKCTYLHELIALFLMMIIECLYYLVVCCENMVLLFLKISSFQLIVKILVIC